MMFETHQVYRVRPPLPLSLWHKLGQQFVAHLPYSR